jgi:hypothetical protein
VAIALPTRPTALAPADFPQSLLAAASHLYATDVRWEAPRRGLTWRGRDAVVRNLLRECAAMRDPEYVPVRRVAGADRIIDEYAVRFVYAGEGIEAAPLAACDRVELERLRVLELVAGRVVVETSIETWTVLPRG